MTIQNRHSRISRLEQAKPRPHVSARKALDHVRDYGPYEAYVALCALLREGTPDQYTQSRRFEWRDERAADEGLTLADQYLGVFPDGPPRMHDLTEEEGARAQELLKLDLPMSFEAFTEFRKIWQIACFGRPQESDQAA